MLRINLVRRIIFANLTFASDGKKFANTCFANTCDVIPSPGRFALRAGGNIERCRLPANGCFEGEKRTSRGQALNPPGALLDARPVGQAGRHPIPRHPCRPAQKPK